MTTTTSYSAAFAAVQQRNERLLQSADALDCALQGFTKIAPTAASTAPATQLAGLFDFADLDDAVYGATPSELPATTLFDDWLANDLNQVSNGYMDAFADMPAYPSSSSGSDSNDSPQITSASCSPSLGFDSMASDSLSGVGFGSLTSLFPEVQAPQAASTPVTPAPVAVAPVAPVAPATLTAESAQQAAAALNIPWSKSLEQAVLAQSILASLPLAMKPAPVVLPASPSPSFDRERSRTPSLPPSTPRMSLSILPSTKTPVPGTNNVTATTYKSAYRSSSLLNRTGLKREREVAEPPSVLDGKDVSSMDEVALKRAKNTDAARRSRHKKMVMVEGLEQRVAELEVENSMFEAKLNEVEVERSLLADKDQMQQARIQELERMLASVRDKLF
ncbi:hypothetical protein EMPS_10164 [Entomortierella parvispora]|uniref:BZIP domain-containing protein n=1 Tax=Entomortierella parvispora TaxID=205924 RepID=A0A9P3HJE5_9FUNG|nr:hypothetical protein EMPS_10164 [Entomortierella parvispora]